LAIDEFQLFEEDGFAGFAGVAYLLAAFVNTYLA